MTAGPRTPRTGIATARSCAFVPMVELLRYLEANGFATYSASGGDRDYLRPFAEELYGTYGSEAASGGRPLIASGNSNGDVPTLCFARVDDAHRCDC